MSARSKRRNAEHAALGAAGWTTYQITPVDRLRSLLRRRTAARMTPVGRWSR
jgi:hypothetical protein